MKDIVKLHDKTFETYISNEQMNSAVQIVADQINRDYKYVETPIFLGILNGSFIFMSELMKRIEFNCEVSFTKIASYDGLNSTGEIRELIGLSDSIKGRNIIIVEDIVDTGNSIEHTISSLAKYEPESVEVATLLMKPDVYNKEIPIKYVAKCVENKFIVGYGLDYNQLGRNLNAIYKIVE